VPVEWIDTGHPAAVRVRMADESAPSGSRAFYRLRYALRFGDEPLLLLRHPQSLTVAEGDSATFTAQVRGSGITHTEWRFNDTPIPGSDRSFHSISPVLPHHAGEYRYRAETPDGVVSSLPATLTVIPNTSAAEVASASFLSSTVLEIRFSEPVAAGGGGTGAENPDRYGLSDGLSIQSATLLEDMRTVILGVEEAGLNQTYTLTVGGIANRAATPVISAPRDIAVRQNAVALINFQSDGLPVPPGWLADHGALFGPRSGGLSYGWSGPPGSTRTRNVSASPDLQHDTLIHAGPADYADDPDWSIALPNGTVSVRLVVGDAHYYENQYDVRVNGGVLVAGSTSRDQRWLEGRAEIEITDGQLILTRGPGARRNKFCFIEIRIP
jgi:hypothetical protein